MNEIYEQDILARKPFNPFRILRRWDKVVLAILLITLVLALTSQQQALNSVTGTGLSLLSVAPFILLSVLLAAYIKATGLDQQIARAFSYSPVRSIFFAAILGALSPFCSCGVIPIIAGLLISGVPLAPVMAFWLASPLMDPEMFILTSAVMGFDFAVVKTIAALGIALFAGFVIHFFRHLPMFQTVLREGYASGCGGPKAPESGVISLKFWQEKARLAEFKKQSLSTGWFLAKWLTLAFLLESIMLRYLPANGVAAHLNGDQWWTLPLSALVGIPAYLNGYAALPTLSALLDKGMDPSAGLTFVIAGGATSIPAAMAVFSLVKKKVFAAYIVFALSGAILSGVLLGPLL
ncbi:permease [Paremcibacter congregatus]|uniref:Permease n=2 Tax=Paremcibacter congregatus TaxID=2043170 RepID=A0A2G4YTS2_9PROT|nr:permease [Paremcibacter congregatus]PHZ85739.1 permease [Paremcibacter congregatus]QDE29172.1 permease [Paremcibacter congregatus]